MLFIGIGLMPTGMNLFGGGAGVEDFGSWQNLGLAMLVLAVILIAYRFGRGILGAASVLVGSPTSLEFGLSFPAAALIGMGAMAIAHVGRDDRRPRRADQGRCRP